MAGWDRPHEVMGNGTYSCLRFREAKQILTHPHNSSNCSQMLRLARNRQFTFSRKVFVHIKFPWAWQSCSRAHRLNKCEVPLGGGRDFILCGRLKSSHLVQLQRTKAVVTKGPGRHSSLHGHVFIKFEAPAMPPCTFHRCMHCALNNFNQ